MIYGDVNPVVESEKCLPYMCGQCSDIGLLHCYYGLYYFNISISETELCHTHLLGDVGVRGMHAVQSCYRICSHGTSCLHDDGGHHG